MNKIQKILTTIGMSAYAFLIAGATTFAQVTTSTTTLGAPTTGAGGNLTANVLILVFSAILVISGIVYLARTSKKA